MDQTCGVAAWRVSFNPVFKLVQLRQMASHFSVSGT